MNFMALWIAIPGLLLGTSLYGWCIMMRSVTRQRLPIDE